MPATTSSVVSLFLYLTTYIPIVLNISSARTYLINSVSFLTLAVFTAFFGYLSDHLDRRRLLMFGTTLLILLTYPLFYGLHHWGVSFLWIFIAIVSIFAAIINGSYVAMMSAFFPPHLRYSGLGLSYSLSVAIFVGIAPLIFIGLIQQFKSPEAPTLYIIACALLTGFSVFKNRGRSL